MVGKMLKELLEGYATQQSVHLGIAEGKKKPLAKLMVLSMCSSIRPIRNILVQ